MGKVRISRNLFVVILGVFIWLISAMIASAAETPETTITIQGTEENRVCTCSCIEMPAGPEVTEGLEIDNVDENTNVEGEFVETQDLASPEIDETEIVEETVETDNQANQVDNQVNQVPIKLIMTELYPAPLSGEIEYMKFLNDGDASADLTGWHLMDASEKKYIFKDLILLPGETFTLDYDTSRISLNNSGDTVYLYDAADNLRQSVEYPEIQKGTVLKYDGVNWSFGEEEEVSIEEEQGQSSEQAALEDSEIADSENVGALHATPEEAEPVEAIQDVIEAPSVDEANQDNQVNNQVNNQVSNQDNQTVEGESILYSPAQITEYQNWLDDSHLTVVGRVISAAGDWVNNRCYLAQGNQAIPVLCTQLASEFILGKTQSVQGEVVFKNGGFYRFDPDLLNTSDTEINLSGEVLSEKLETYKIYDFQGLVRDVSEKYFKVEIETEAGTSYVLRWAKSQNWLFPAEGDVIKGLAMADTNGQLWLWETWEIMVAPEVLDGTEAVEAAASAEAEAASDEPVLPTAYLGLGAAGLLGGGKAAWTYRDALKKFVPKKFKA